MSPIGDCSEGAHGSIGDWDVSGMTKMGRIFSDASAFNQDLSKWDVSAVTYMRFMFYDASAFERELCGAAWVHSKADKEDMFKDSPGSIASTVRPTAPTTPTGPTTLYSVWGGSDHTTSRPDHGEV